MRTTLGALALVLLLAPLARAQSFADKDPDRRCRALAKAEVGDLDAVVQALGDPVERVRRSASRAILRLGAPAITPLLEATQGPSARRQRMAYATLPQIDPRLAATLQGRLRSAAAGGNWAANSVLIAVCRAGLADDATVLALAESDPNELAGQPWTLPALSRCLRGTRSARGAALDGLVALGLEAAGVEDALDGLIRAGALDEEELPRAVQILARLGAVERLLAIQRDQPGQRLTLIGGALGAGEFGLSAALGLVRQGPPLDEERWREVLSCVSSLIVGRGYVPVGALPILRLALRAPSPALRARAVWVAAEMGPVALPEVLRSLEDPAAEVRLAAARVAREDELCAGGGDTSALDAVQARLGELLCSDASEEVRQAVAETLARQVRPAPALREALVRALSDPSEEVQAFATQALGRFDYSDRELRKLLSQLATSPARSWDVRASALGALADQGDFREVNRLLLESEPDQLEILAPGLKDRTYLRVPGDMPLSRDACLALLRAPAPVAQSHGAEFLHRVAPRDPKLTESLRRIMRNLRSDAARSYLLEGIAGSLDPADFRRWLIPEGGRAPGSDWLHRRIGRAWGDLEDPSSLVAALSRPQASRLDFFYLTVNLGPRHAGLLPAFRERLRGPEREVTREVLDGLQAMGPAAKPALPELLGLLPPSSPNAWRGAVRVLGAIGPEAAPALPRLVPLLRSSHNYLVVEVFEALASMGEAAGPALPVMRECLAGAEGIVPEATLRPFARTLVAAAEAGETSELEPSLQALVAAVDTTSSFWPEDALEALAVLGPHAEPVAETLLDFALDPLAPLDERSLAADALISADPSREGDLTEGLARSLRSLNADERLGAANLLVERRAKLPATAGVALRALRETKDGYRQEEWIAVLGRCGSVGAAALSELLEAEPPLAEAAAGALGQLDPDQAAPLVLAALTKGLRSPRPGVRVTCANVLLARAKNTPAPDEGSLARGVEVLLRDGKPDLSPDQLEAAGPAGAGALEALIGALDDRRRRPAALRGIAALGSAALPAAPRLRTMVREGAPGCVYAACALLDLGPKDELLGRTALRAWVPDLPRDELAYPALQLGRPRGAATPGDRALALRALERCLLYRGLLARGEREALRACLALGERAFVERLRDDPRSRDSLRQAAQELLPPGKSD